MAKRVHVAVGVIVDRQQQILISRRHDDAHQGGLWEFPGGKVEAGEPVTEALARELKEELGIECPDSGMQALIEIHHDYSDKHVLLDVWWVRDFKGEARGLEGQPLSWVAPDALADHAFPAANAPIIDAVLNALECNSAQS